MQNFLYDDLEPPGVGAGDPLQQVCTSAGLQPLTYSEAVKLGKPPAEAGAGEEVRPRPVLVKFAALQQKHELLQQSKVLCSQKAYLDDDLTPFQHSMRAKLSNVFKVLKFYKRPRIWRQERLFTVFEGELVPCDLRTVPPSCCRAAAARRHSAQHEYSGSLVHGAETSMEQHASDKVVAPLYGCSCDESISLEG